jgi:hypothetical protein
LEGAPLTQQRISRFFLPLAFSWVFMAVEAPVSISVISRKPGAETNTAAFLLMMGLALWIESPVIDLLSTSTTLTRDRRSFEAMKRFAQMMMAWVTVAHFLLVFTPLYGMVAYGLMDAPVAVGEAARSGLMVMLPWSALIGWRRYLQGILIRNGLTKAIGFGTTVRVATMCASSLLLFLLSGWPSIVIVATALILSVGAEALFVHAVSRRVVRETVLSAESADDALSTRRLVKFHLPLTATTMVLLLSTPIVTSALTRTAEAVTTMAAFQVASTLLFLFRTMTFATPEVVITLSGEPNGPEALRRFCLVLGTLLSGLLLLFAVTPLDDDVFHRILGADRNIAGFASYVLLLSCLMPLIGSAQGFVRGMLTAHHLTVSRMLAVLVSVAVLGVSLAIGVRQQWHGLLLAPVSLTISLIAELAVLSWAWHRGRSHLPIPTAAG